MGVVFLATPFVGVLNREWHSETLMRLAGRGGPLVAGAAFAIAWTPCTSITLGAILTQAAISSSAAHGALLLAFYSAGLAIPFLLIALAFERMTIALRVVKRHFPVIIAIGGAVMIVLGVLILTGEFTIAQHQGAGTDERTRAAVDLRLARSACGLARRTTLAVAGFPGLLVALGVEYERREADRLDDQPVDRRLREGQRPHHVDEQHDAGLVGVVPDLVVEGVVEDHRLLPSSQWRMSSPTRIRQDSASSGTIRPRW